jgi:hypothetical protein
VAGGAGSEHTQRANVSAFRRWGLIPRMFASAAQRDLSVDLFGMRLPSPLLMAPIHLPSRLTAGARHFLPRLPLPGSLMQLPLPGSLTQRTRATGRRLTW